MDVSRGRKRAAYRFKSLLASHQLQFRYNDEEWIISVQAPRSQRNIPLLGQEEDELRIHLTRTQYALFKRLLERLGETVSLDELVELVLSTSSPQPTRPWRALASHIYRLRKLLPKFVVLYCESGKGYALLLQPIAPFFAGSPPTHPP